MRTVVSDCLLQWTGIEHLQEARVRHVACKQAAMFTIFTGTCRNIAEGTRHGMYLCLLSAGEWSGGHYGAELELHFVLLPDHGLGVGYCVRSVAHPVHKTY